MTIPLSIQTSIDITLCMWPSEEEEEEEEDFGFYASRHRSDMGGACGLAHKAEQTGGVKGVYGLYR